MAKEARHNPTPIGRLDIAPDWEKIEAEWARRDRNEPTPEERRLTDEHVAELKSRPRGARWYDLPDLPPEAFVGTAVARYADGRVLGEGPAAFDESGITEIQLRKVFPPINRQ